MFIASGPAACHCFAGDSAGNLYSWGRNEVRVLGLAYMVACAGPMPGDYPTQRDPTYGTPPDPRLGTATRPKAHPSQLTYAPEAY